jgi:hypothetical protein
MILSAGANAFAVADGTCSVRRLRLSFQGGSLSPEAIFIGAFTRCHRFGKSGI